MNTIRIISSVSFNTLPFFEATVAKLCRQGKGQVLDWCHWIQHKPDSDQKKPHIHFVCKPSRRVDTNDLRREFIEPTDALVVAKAQRGEQVSPDDLKPLGCLPFVTTNQMKDWLLYAVHDIPYLYQKGQTRKVHYERKEVQSTDPDFLLSQWDECNNPIQALTERVLQMYTVEQLTFSQILQTAIIPPNLVYYFKQILEGLEDPTIRRKGKWIEP